VTGKTICYLEDF